MSESNARRYLHLDLDSFRPPPRVPVATRVITNERYPQIAALTVEGYAGTTDDEHGYLEDALGELVATCTRFAGIPFVAFTFTSHLDTGRGLATNLVADVASRLSAEGESSLSLVVTVGRTA